MNTLENLREQIDEVDNKLLQLLQERIAIMKQVGDAKKELQKPIRDAQREEQKLTELTKQADLLHIPKQLVTNIWKVFFEISEEIEK